MNPVMHRDANYQAEPTPSDRAADRLHAGLRVDVDTYRGTERGVPRLLDTLDRHGVRATFFFSVGPDNMGRHLWRLLRPAFLWKMLRSGAPSLYGWSILGCGLVGNGPDIGADCAAVIRETAAAGHEVGLHAWDHQRWQSMDIDDTVAVTKQLRLGYERLRDILGAAPPCSAAPAWRAPAAVLAAKATLPLRYNSDCRGRSCFIPLLPGGTEGQPQIPVTLPTYDELIGANGVTDDTYNNHLMKLFRPTGLNVLCIHAEVEGIAKAELFEDFLDMAHEAGIRFAPLGTVLAEQPPPPRGRVSMRVLPGREGELSFQSPE